MSTPNSPLPLRFGVAASHVWLAQPYAGNILDFLCEKFPHVDLSTWQTRMQRGEVRDQNNNAIEHDSPYRVGLCLFYYRDVAHEETKPFEIEILFQNEHLLVVDKPHFLPTIPTGQYVKETLLSRLRDRLSMPHLSPLHRLDRDTAGVVMFSTAIATRGCYQRLFEQQKIAKLYHAVAPDNPELSFPMRVRHRIERDQLFFRSCIVSGTPNSETRIEKLHSNGTSALYALYPTTGKKHQLRVHMASLGIPILNDPWYPVLNPDIESKKLPLQLVAKKIAFIDPLTHHPFEISSQRELTL